MFPSLLNYDRPLTTHGIHLMATRTLRVIKVTTVIVLIFLECKFLRANTGLHISSNRVTVTSQQYSEPTVSISSNDDFNRFVQTEVSSPAWLSNHPEQKQDNFEWIVQDTFTKSVPSSVEPTIIPPEPRSAVLAAVTGGVVELKASAVETTAPCYLLFVSHRSAPLSKSASLLAGCDDEVEFDATTDEYAVHKQYGATTNSSWAAGPGSDQPPSIMPSNTHEQPQSGSTRTAGGVAGGGGCRGTTSIDAMSNRADTSRTSEHPSAPNKTEKHRAAESDAAASTVAVRNHPHTVKDMDASETTKLTCRHQLLLRVREVLKGDCYVDTSELVQTLRYIGHASPNLNDEANSLAEDVMRAEAPIHDDKPRKDLVAILKMLLYGRLDVANNHRKVKSFVYGMHSDTLKELSASSGRRPGECLTLSLEQQKDLLQQALGCGDVGDSQGDDSFQPCVRPPEGRCDPSVFHTQRAAS